MWKKLDDLESVPPNPSSSKQEEDSVTQMLMSAIRGVSQQKEQQIDNPEPKVGRDEEAFQEYAEAVDQFTKSAKEFIRCAPLFSEARQAYEKLRTTSERIRKSLDSDEQQFRILMDLAKDQANVHLAPTQSSLEGKKPPESSRPEPFIVNGDGKKMTKFP